MPGFRLSLRRGSKDEYPPNLWTKCPSCEEMLYNKQLDKNIPFVKLWLDSELGTMPKMSPAITQAIIDTAHKRNTRVVAHVFYLEDARRLVNQGLDALVHSVRDKPLDQPLIDAMKRKGVWQAAATLSREASMFAYESTPDFASDPFFTRGRTHSANHLILVVGFDETERIVSAGTIFQMLFVPQNHTCQGQHECRANNRHQRTCFCRLPKPCEIHEVCKRKAANSDRPGRAE